MHKISTNEKVANGDFEIFVEAEVVHKKQKFISLDSLINLQMQYKRKLDQLIPTKLGKLLPVVMLEGGISIALGLVLSEQGSLQESQSGVMESAREEVNQKFKEAEKISLASIKAGNKIAKEMLRNNMTREDLEVRLTEVEDERVIRNVIDAARYPKTTVDFKHSSQNIGGCLEIARDVVANGKIRLNNCKVVGVIGSGEFDVETEDINKIYERQDTRKNLVRVTSDPSSPLSFFMHLAGGVSTRFDFEIRVTEEIKSKKLKFIVTKLVDPMQVLSAVETNITYLKKTLQLGFDFT